MSWIPLTYPAHSAMHCFRVITFYKVRLQPHRKGKCSNLLLMRASTLVAIFTIKGCQLQHRSIGPVEKLWTAHAAPIGPVSASPSRQQANQIGIVKRRAKSVAERVPQLSPS